MVGQPGATARRLGLQSHPEGGWFRRTWTSPATVDSSRPAVTLIHFLLQPGESSAWHVGDAGEVWLWHGPGPLRLQLGGTDDSPTVSTPPILLGDVAQAFVPARTWQCTGPVEEEVLLSCLVSPGFSYEGFKLLD